MVLDSFPDEYFIRIPLPPLQSVVSIKYYGTDNTEYTMSTDDYFVDIKSEPGRIALAYNKSWPSLKLRPVNGVIIELTTGYANFTGTVNTVGTAVTKVSGTDFDTSWPAGKSIEINGVLYQISSVTSASSLTLMATAGNQNGVTYLTNNVPEKIKAAIKLVLGHLYEHREEFVEKALVKVPMAAEALLWQDRIVSF
jgi:hypothetical protein